MNCECCGSWIEDEEPVERPQPSPEEALESRIIHEFRKKTDPSYARYCQTVEDMERSFLFGAGSILATTPRGLVGWAT